MTHPEVIGKLNEVHLYKLLKKKCNETEIKIELIYGQSPKDGYTFYPILNIYAKLCKQMNISINWKTLKR